MKDLRYFLIETRSTHVYTFTPHIQHVNILNRFNGLTDISNYVVFLFVILNIFLISHMRNESIYLQSA